MRRITASIFSSVSLVALSTTPALAQVTGAPVETTPQKTAESSQLPPATELPTNANGQPVTSGAIVVTGSRLRRDNFNTPSPVTIVTRDDQILAGASGTAETLQNASITSGTSQISSAFLGFLSEGGQGANTVGLRGLGSQRTLVLLNGRRLAPAGVGSQLVAADLNVLPTAVVQRIEVLREGASAVYGSDAIAGVINVITDTKLNGVTLDAYADLPLNLVGAAGRTYRGSVTAGKTFDRGYILASVEYRQRNGVRFQDNPDWRCPRALYQQNGHEVGQVDPATGQLACFAFGPNGSAGSGIASGYGLYGTFFPYYGNIYTLGRKSYRNGDINQPLAVNNFLLRPIKSGPQLASSVISPVRTITGYLNGAYQTDVLGNAEIYGEALFTRRRSVQKSATQISIQTAQLDPNIEIYGGNAYYCPNGTTSCPITNYAPPSQPGGAAFPNYKSSPFFPNSFLTATTPYSACCGIFGINRFNPFILPDQLQRASQKVDFWRANAGLRGDMGVGDWRYDANVQLSRTDANEKLSNPTITTMSNVLMTAVAPTGTPSQFITTAIPGEARAGVSFTCASNVTNGAYNGGTCVPLDIFNPNILIGGHIPQALYDYLYVPQVQRTRFNQDTLSLNLDGTVLDLPAGPVRAAVGFEYRRDRITNTPSPDAQAGQLYNRTNEGITAGYDSVKEAYGEVNIPLLKDRPLAKSLEVAASGRYTDYKSYGSGFVYRLNAQYAPTDLIRFRASLGTNFRAPNLYEQFVNNQTGFFGGGSDPCDSFGTLSPTTPTYQNCLRELTPILDNPTTAVNEALTYVNANSILVNTAGGRANLKAEKAKSYGFGAVVTAPREVADLSLAVDYFHTLVTNEVGTLGLTILNLCYGADPSTFPNNNYCPFINGRFPVGSAYPGTIISFQNPYLNLARQISAGIDFNGRYATRVAGGRFIAELQATRMVHQQLEIFQGNGLFEYNGTLGYPGFGSGPKWTGNLDARYERGPFTFRWGVQYIGRSSANELVQPNLLYPTNGGTGIAGQPYQEDLVAEAYWEHGVSVRYRYKKRAEITVGVKNLFNEKPPTISDSQDPFGQYFRIANYFGGGPYDYLGRSVFINLTSSF
ncbi:TonB-dependent receptor domain-containing protein [Sphingomonas sp.]|uniref:TonB-dependent receptor domain-containing protein n=1 Tax=Sphingomonas sp. TaxID=28214 RepID=UPI00389D9CDB